MLIIRKRAYARAGLLGNPSDGYHGKTISFIVRNFWAEVVLYEWDSVDIVLAENDRARFSSIQDLARDVQLHGYYGGIRLVKATIKRFVDYCEREGLALHERNFSVRYETSVPQQVGLAGSSAIIVATLRCLMEFYGVADSPARPAVAGAVGGDRGAGHRRRAAGSGDPVLRGAGLHGLRQWSKEQIVAGLKCYEYEPLTPRSAAAVLRRLSRRIQRADRDLPQRHPGPLRPGRRADRRSHAALRRLCRGGAPGA